MIKYTDKYLKLLDETLTDPLYPEMNNFSILVTGATGMIGSCIVDLLLRHNQNSNAQIEIYAMGRSLEKAKSRFFDAFSNDHFHFIQQDVTSPLMGEATFDYIIHAASNANPKLYATEPVETLMGNILGMSSLLEYTKVHPVKRIVFVSSGEMYGVASENLVGFSEDFVGYVDYSSARSCYPAGKRAAEVLIQSYISEFGTDANIVRPCHTYGPTMSDTDNRAISSFIRNGVRHEDIILKSEGKQIRSHCMVTDSATGMFYAMMRGTSGEAYNIAADESTYSIREMAELVCDISGQKLKIDAPTETESKGFSKVPVAVLNNDKIKTLGWQSKYSLQSGLAATIEILSSSEVK